MANRFIKQSDGAFTGVTVITDTATGVQYLYYEKGYGGGLTPLLDREGKPIIAPTSGYHPEDK